MKTNMVTLRLVKQVYSDGQFSFSTKHDSDVVRKWIDKEGGWGSQIVSQWNETDEEVFVEDRDVYEGQGDSDCPYDDVIQEWKNRQKKIGSKILRK